MKLVTIQWECNLILKGLSYKQTLVSLKHSVVEFGILNVL